MLCCSVVCSAVQCNAVLCCVALWCSVQCCAVLRCAVQCNAVLCLAVLCFAVLCCTVLHFAALCCDTMCCFELCLTTYASTAGSSTQLALRMMWASTGPEDQVPDSRIGKDTVKKQADRRVGGQAARQTGRKAEWMVGNNRRQGS